METILSTSWRGKMCPAASECVHLLACSKHVSNVSMSAGTGSGVGDIAVPSKWNLVSAVEFAVALIVVA
eukprot:909538-Rhodomonas_salina.1